MATALIGASVATAVARAAAPPPKNGPENHKVTLCHATPPSSAKNGWVPITVSTNAVTHAGHGAHADDIIPPFTYYVQRTAHQYPGKNLATVFFGSTGAQILANGCRLPVRPTTAPPSTSAPASTSEPASSSAAASSSGPGTTSDADTSAAAGSAAPESSSAAEATITEDATSVDAPASLEVIGTQTARAGGRGAAPAVVAHAGLAAGDTGDAGGSGSSAGLIAAVIGGAVAGLLGLGGLAYRRRARS